jgi:trk system potassium uptake protein
MFKSINVKLICKAIGLLLLLETCFMGLAILVALYYGEDVQSAFLPSLFITFGSAVWLIIYSRESTNSMGKRDGFLIVTLAWALFSFFGAIPFYISGYLPSFVDAYFETVSGFTTTGSTIIKDVEALPNGLLFWRSMTHWMGGMGIIVFTIAFLPLLKAGGVKLFAAESTGPMKTKIHPRISDTARRLYYVYIFLTALLVILLFLEGMSLFDAVCHSFGAIATGGFSTRNASIAYYNSPIIDYTITLFIFFSGVNFILLYFLFKGKLKRFWDNEELRWYLGIILFTSLFIAVCLYMDGYGGVEKSFRDSLFQVTSAITTTGYTTTDFMSWDPMLWTLLLFAMITGSSAGSTAGGAKIVRVVIVMKNIRAEFQRFLHPNAVIPVRMDHAVVSSQVVTNTLVFLFSYLLLIFLSTFILAVTGMSFENSFGASVSAISNIGMTVGEYSATSTFCDIPQMAKAYLSFLMLIGRLEIFTMLMIFTPYFWRN